MDNRYGKTSKLDLTMEYRENKTILSDVFFTAPFKIIKPFYDRDYMQIMQITEMTDHKASNAEGTRLKDETMIQ